MTKEQILPKLDFRTDHPTQLRMAEAAAKFCAHMEADAPPYILAFLGGSGVGKTHLAKKISQFFKARVSRPKDWSRDNPVVRRGGLKDWRKVCADARSGELGFLRDLQEDFFLALDDIGSEYRTDSQFTDSLLDQIIEPRIGRRWTVVCSNLSLQEIAETIDVRIASRLRRAEGVVVECFDVPDFNFATP